MGHERVYTIHDYWDGPREGVADFNGRPHVYRCVFDRVKDDWTQQFRIKLLTQEQFDAVMADWQLWLRWDDALRRGLTTSETHPTLPEDRPERERLRPMVTAAFDIPNDALLVHGAFESADVPDELVVTWQVIEGAKD